MSADYTQVEVLVTDANGDRFVGTARLVPASRGKSPSKSRSTASNSSNPDRGATAPKFDFSLPTRAFVKKFAKDLSGHQRFALLLAKLSEGKVGVPIDTSVMKKNWQKMQASLGKYNSAYATRAHDEGWVHPTSNRGSYALTKNWKNIFN